ncbi:globin domain-containing protein [Synechococcus sp. Cruz CV-v-12]|uniref:globin domain-containing protein n=1 Tax=Synechococcus sp. Cruz CV-v-12 TaxID=2823728 RepID=UPI0020CE957A|nr:globin domain-containing protein [Synechococcus sp. Cruz CV-v-12]MCP9874701.1 flavohemoprotein [Synechococcus sp. Cruz CV-v-12]
MPLSRHPLATNVPGWAKVPIDRAAIDRLRASFDLLLADGSRLTAIFYAKLFERYPGVRALFPTDMRAQEGKLMDSLRAVVAHLEAPQGLQAELRAMGARHVKYGAKTEHYPLVRDLLIESMADAAGKGWSPELNAEWTQAISIVSDIMLEGAATVKPDQAS